MAANIPSDFGTWSTTDASNQPDSTDTADLPAEFQRIQAVMRKYVGTASTLAAAATVDLSTAAGNTITLTGTATTITSFGTVAAGLKFTIISNAAHTITHNATSLILPNASNILTASGDVIELTSLGSGNWKCTGSTAQPEKIAPTFLNSWVNVYPTFNADDAAYWKDSSGNVHIQGGVSSGTMGSAVFTLPSGYRPTRALGFAIIVSNGSNVPTLGFCQIASTGDVIINSLLGSNQWVYLDGITFRAA